MNGHIKSSPSKHSPRKSPTFKVPSGKPRGRPRKLDPKQLNFVVHNGSDENKQAKLGIANKAPTTHPIEHVEAASTTADDNPDRRFITDVHGRQVVIIPYPGKNKSVATPTRPINICGAVTLDEVKELLHEWMISTSSKYFSRAMKLS